MAIRHQRSVWVGLASAACAFVLSGCASADAARPGQLELRIEPAGSYALIGRFRVSAIEPWSPSRDIDFDATTSGTKIELPPGTFALTLGAGARLVCAGEEASLDVVPRLVSALPRVLSIAAGEVTRARIAFGSAPASRADVGAEAAVARAASPASGPADAADPCGTRAELGGRLAARR